MSSPQSTAKPWPSGPPADRTPPVLGGRYGHFCITGIGYAALLANEEVGLTAAWVDAALHQVTPAVLLVDWVCFPGARGRTRAASGRDRQRRSQHPAGV